MTTKAVRLRDTGCAGDEMASSVKQSKSRADAKHDALAESGVAPNFPKNSSRKERAAILLAEDDLSDQAIADAVGVTKRTITNWKHDPEFAALVGDHHGQLQASARKFSIAKRYKRIEAMDKLWHRHLEAIDRRADGNKSDDEAMNAARAVFGDAAPEAVTGLFAKKQSISASGRVVVDYVYDSGLMREIRELMKQAAQDNGDWTEKSEVEQNTTTMVQIIGDDWEDD